MNCRYRNQLENKLFEVKYGFKKIAEGIKHHGLGIIKGNLGIGEEKKFLGYGGVHMEYSGHAAIANTAIAGMVTFLSGHPELLIVVPVTYFVSFLNAELIVPYIREKVTK